MKALEGKQQIEDRVRLMGNTGNGDVAALKFTAAVQMYKQAIVLCGDCDLRGALEKNLGLAYCHTGELDACERHLKTAQSLVADDPDIVTALHLAEQERHQTSIFPQ